jgi:uridine kinase
VIVSQLPILHSTEASILGARAAVPPTRGLLVGLTGIDGSGKGFVARLLVESLRERGLNTVSINIDGWLNLPAQRFSARTPALHFYKHAIRFDEMFDQLVLPLKHKRSHRVLADLAEETATAFRPELYEFQDVDIIVLEGIYLLKRAYRAYFDVCFWIDCTFRTALERAIARAQEGLGPHETRRAYHTIYFPAQRIHFRRDHPRETATGLITNDPRLAPNHDSSLLAG